VATNGSAIIEFVLQAIPPAELTESFEKKAFPTVWQEIVAWIERCEGKPVPS
jgi:hypothetical protein